MFLVFWLRNLWLWLSEFVSVPLMMLWHFSNLIRRPPGPLSTRWIWLCALMRVCLCEMCGQISTVYTHTCARERISRQPRLSWMPTAFVRDLTAEQICTEDGLKRLSSTRRHTSLHFFLWVSNGLWDAAFPKQLSNTLTSRQKICFRLLSFPSGLQSTRC